MPLKMYAQQTKVAIFGFNSNLIIINVVVKNMAVKAVIAIKENYTTRSMSNVVCMIFYRRCIVV